MREKKELPLNLHTQHTAQAEVLRISFHSCLHLPGAEEITGVLTICTFYIFSVSSSIQGWEIKSYTS